MTRIKIDSSERPYQHLSSEEIQERMWRLEAMTYWPDPEYWPHRDLPDPKTEWYMLLHELASLASVA